MVRNTAWMIVGQGGNFFLQAGYFLLLARLVGVTEYGVFAGAFALVSFVTVYSSLGSSMIFMRYVSADRDSAQVYWGNILAISAGASLLLVPILAWTGSKLFGPGSVGLIVVLVVANCFMSQITNSASMVFQTFEHLKITAWLRALSNLLRLLVIAALVMVFHHATAFQCSLGILVSSAIAAGLSLVWVRSVIGRMRFSGRLIRLHFWEGIGFSFAASTQSVYNDVDKMMLSHYGMNAANGIYTMAYRVVDFATTPVIAIDAAVLPRFFALNRDGVTYVNRMARKVVPIAALAGLAATGFTLLASPIVVRLAGHGFADAMLAVRWLCWLPALRGVHQLAGGALTATGKQNYRTAAQLLVALLNFALNLMWIPKHGWLGAAWASLISDGVLGVLNICFVLLVLSSTGQHRHSNSIAEEKK
jgi:O-antigen/teichoic acid export membrane protein